jgi:mRNA interferase RelE/StbE
LSWTLLYEPGAEKDLKRLDRAEQRFILESLDRLAAGYSPAFISELVRTGKLKRLKGEWKGYFRLRLRSWRVIYLEYHQSLLILVVRIGHRSGVYE